jgi:diguanylate cyclase (GGDEF)-like protein
MASNPRRWSLIILSPWSEPREQILETGSTLLGRQSDNTIVIVDDSASRCHAEIAYAADPDNLLLRDLNSTNGTFVNGERVTQPCPLQPRDCIRIGQHLLHVTRRVNRASPAALIYPVTRAVTRELILEGAEQHAILLHDVAARLNLILDLPQALEEVSQIVRIALGADKCEVVLAERFPYLAEMGLPTTIAQQAIEQRAMVAVLDTAAMATPMLAQSGQLLKIRSLICVPILIADQVAGLLYLYKTEGAARLFAEHDLPLALGISHQAALTIQRARLLEKVQQLEVWATTDDLTRVYNRRQFFMLGDREFHRARRFGRPLTALMLDVDRFKAVNDEYGHAAGDAILKAVAERCRAHLRDVDLLGRYGGDELVALLAETEAASAVTIAERCRQALADRPVDTPAGALAVTLCIGIATRTEQHVELAALLLEADAALYAAKRGGRNRVGPAPGPAQS